MGGVEKSVIKMNKILNYVKESVSSLEGKFRTVCTRAKMESTQGITSDRESKTRNLRGCTNVSF